MPITIARRVRRNPACLVSLSIVVATIGCQGHSPIRDREILGTTAPPSPPAELHQAFNVKAFGAKGDGRADDTVPLQTAIDSVPPAGGVVYLPVGIYRTTKPVRLKPQLRLIGATRRSWADDLSSLGSRILADHEGHGLYLEYDRDTGGNILIETETDQLTLIVANQFHATGGEGIVGIDIRSPKASRVIVSDNTLVGFRIGIRDQSGGINLIQGNVIDSWQVLQQKAEGLGIEMNPADGAWSSVVSANITTTGKAGIRHVQGDRVTYVGNATMDSQGKPQAIEVMKGKLKIIE